MSSKENDRSIMSSLDSETAAGALQKNLKEMSIPNHSQVPSGRKRDGNKFCHLSALHSLPQLPILIQVTMPQIFKADQSTVICCYGLSSYPI